MTGFVPGLELCRRFYEEVVAPGVGARHEAGLPGPGSDVLGYDTERSTDHDWGPRCQLFVQASDLDEVRSRVLTSLPKTYDGRLPAFGRDGGPLEPHVVVTTLPAWLEGELGWDLGARELTVVDWLVIPQTRLLGITQGAVFADPDGYLAHLRRRLAWYPDPVWWWLLACQWQRLSQEEPFVQRTAEVGDQLGSAVLAGRLVRDCMRLALLIGRKYAPYSKWLGTAFAGIPDPDGLGSSLAEAVATRTLMAREAALGRAYQLLGERFNALSPGSRLDTSLGPFHDRPALVLGAGRFSAASLERVEDPVLTRLPLVGAVDQLLDCMTCSHTRRIPPHPLLLRRLGRGESAVDEERRPVARYERAGMSVGYLGLSHSPIGVRTPRLGSGASGHRSPYELTAALSLSIIQSFADVERRYLKIRIAVVFGCDGQRFGQRPVRSSSLIANGASLATAPLGPVPKAPLWRWSPRDR
jgi:hypothetical protein